MSFGGISLGPLSLILVIVVLLFGTKERRTIGTELGGAIRRSRSGGATTRTRGAALRNGAPPQNGRREHV